MKLIWSRRSRQDLFEIGRYIAIDNRPAARRWVERLRYRAQKATEHPEAGRMVPEHSRPELRELLLGNYRILYFVREETMEVITVFEGHKMFPADALPPEED